jgi:hypothetical protein
MTRKTFLFAAVLALASWAVAQQPSSPVPPPAGSPPPPPAAGAAPSTAPATQPPDAPAPPPSPNAGQSTSADQNAAQPQSSSEAAEQSQNQSGRPLTSDEARTQIDKKLHSEPGLTSRNIHVDVTDNAVVLNGSVPTTNQSLLAQRIAQSFAGSRRVTNHLTIETNSPGATGASPSSGKPEQATPPESQGGQSQPPE